MSSFQKIRAYRVFVARARALSWLPELNLMLFAFLLNEPWELIQAPLFEGMADRPHWEAVRACTQAALGDAVIMLFAYWGVAVMTRGRVWVVAPRWRELALLSALGLGITVVIELLALRGAWVTGWTYSALMPVIPGLGVGLVPLLQWVVLPPLAAALTGRQLRGKRKSLP